MNTLSTLSRKVILFDLDGVLVHSVPSSIRSWSRWAEFHNLDADEVLATVHGRRAVDVMQEFVPHLPAKQECQRLEEIEINDTSDVVATPGAVELLSMLPEDNWAIVTSGSQAIATARIKAAGLPFPRVLVSADDVSQGKPHPEGYLMGGSLLSAAPEECLVIEDAVAGIHAAHAAGISVLAVGSTYSVEELHEAEAWIPTLGSLDVSLIDHHETPLQINLVA